MPAQRSHRKTRTAERHRTAARHRLSVPDPAQPPRPALPGRRLPGDGGEVSTPGCAATTPSPDHLPLQQHLRVPRHPATTGRHYGLYKIETFGDEESTDPASIAPSPSRSSRTAPCSSTTRRPVGRRHKGDFLHVPEGGQHGYRSSNGAGCAPSPAPPRLASEPSMLHRRAVHDVAEASAAPSCSARHLLGLNSLRPAGIPQALVARCSRAKASASARSSSRCASPPAA